MTKTMAKDKPTGIIYFVQQGTEGPIKVGYTEQSIRVRLAGLQVGNPCELYAIKIIDGTRVDEANVHSRFNDCHIRGEWFLPTKRLMRFIKCLDNGVGVKPEIIRVKGASINDDVDELRALAIKRSNGR